MGNWILCKLVAEIKVSHLHSTFQITKNLYTLFLRKRNSVFVFIFYIQIVFLLENVSQEINQEWGEKDIGIVLKGGSKIRDRISKL